ncbi:hypothetical protein CD58_10215 [Pseudomonas brassicacearum]|uniref:delta-60 repeat domain-containing protein n=1 Tax=Pseudomonas brassicacearum TaxID=930166 RepID=UPI00042E5F84|nr:delta-60 repeat domain-containing protein [Pseudomonas brassicacearum]AHL36853.1 hypothetical protein CD58_10215 [Pseudomonas brassicacearum]
MNTDKNKTKNVASTRAGEFDPEFNNGEIVLLPGTDATDVAIGPGNKIYVVGGTSLGSNSQYIISALNPDGTPDVTFNGGEPVRDSFTAGSTSLAERVCVLPDGKILILGKVILSGTRSNFALARYLPTGTRDLSFGVNGHSVPINEDFIDIGLASYDFVDVPGTQGYLYVGQTSLFLHGEYTYISGFALKDGKGITLLMCLDDTGTPAYAFGNKGGSIIQHPQHNYHLNARSLLITDSHIYLAGHMQINPTNYMVWARVHLNGSLDLSFGSGGFVFEINPSFVRGINIAAIVSRDSVRLLGSGVGRDASTRYLPHAMLTSIERDGKNDPEFNDGVPVLTPVDTKSQWHDSMIQLNGRIVTCGSAGTNNENLIVGRYMPNGTLDASFGDNNGLVKIRMKDELLSSALAVQLDNSIVVVGRYAENLYVTPFALRLKG